MSLISFFQQAAGAKDTLSRVGDIAVPKFSGLICHVNAISKTDCGDLDPNFRTSNVFLKTKCLFDEKTYQIFVAAGYDHGKCLCGTFKSPS